MFCNNCKTPFDLVTIDTGKSKFCRNCGSVLYRNINGTIVFETGTPVLKNQFDLQKNQDLDAERLRQEMILKQRQLEIDQQKQIEANRLQQEQLLRQREAEIEREKALEAERLRLAKIEQQRILEQQKLEQAEKIRQEQLIKERQLELQRQKEAEELQLAEIEKKRQEEIRQQQAAEFARQQQIRIQKEEEERFKKEKQDREFKELELQREQERVFAEQQRLEREREDAINKQKEPELEYVTDKESGHEPVRTKSNVWKYVIVAIIALASGAGGYFLIDKFVLTKSGINQPLVESKTDIIPLLTAEKIRADLNGKDIIGWGTVENADITSILTEKQTRNDSIICISTLLLAKNNLKSKAEVTIVYIDTIPSGFITNEITYQNTAPAKSWFNFSPVPNSAIIINTNNNPIQLKTCETCDVVKLNTNNDTTYRISTDPTTIFITSDNKFDAVVDFIYVPKTN